jgi:hypothetical protein
VFCKIRCSLTRLQKHADLVNYMVPFDPDALRKVCKEGRDVSDILFGRLFFFFRKLFMFFLFDCTLLRF